VSLGQLLDQPCTNVNQHKASALECDYTASSDKLLLTLFVNHVPTVRYSSLLSVAVEHHEVTSITCSH
jgi:hypothetical protein